jgi:predicted transposase/invertase (TIGR01784 family)
LVHSTVRPFVYSPWVQPRRQFSIIKENNTSYNAQQAKRDTIDHDRLFKELIRVFFREFVELFFPDAHAAIDYSEVHFLDQEVFTDVTTGEKRRIDLLVQVKLKGEPTAIIVHVENQAYRQQEFNERMFVYFSRLYEKHRMKILPIAVFSHGDKRIEPDGFEVTFPFHDVLKFSFYKLELHQHDWRKYIKQDNPTAAALLCRMKYSQEERVQVKKEFLRMLVRLQLDPARTQLVVGFFDQYLKLNEEEEKQLKEEIQELNPQETEEIFRIETSWERRGRIEGNIEGKIEVARRMLASGMSLENIMRFTELPRDVIEKQL